MITSPLPSAESWCAYFVQAPIPVLARSMEEVETLSLLNDASDDVDARMIADAIESDPLMTLRILTHVSMNRRPSQVTDVETVTAAVLLMGITTFFKTFSQLPTVNHHLSAIPEALEGLNRVIKRARRAALYAQAIAIERKDEDIAAIYVATLLHDFTEMLLWCHAPTLALEIAQRQAADPQLRSAVAQQSVLGVELATVEQLLMKAWRLPELLTRIVDDRFAHLDQVATVSLAVRIARHSQNGWDNPALPDDFIDLGSLLGVMPSAASQLIRALDN